MEVDQAKTWKTVTDLMRRAMTGDTSPGNFSRSHTIAFRLRKWGEQPSNPWMRPRIVPIPLQMLQAEEQAVRRVLIDLLAKIPGAEAGSALAHRAVFDPLPELRQAAVDQLRQRPDQEGHNTLVAALRHLWPPAAEHAADALLALQAKDTISELINLLDEPEPSRPVLINSPPNGLVVCEFVRLNHLRNCFLCHLPAHNVRENLVGLVPSPMRALAPSFERRYYSEHQQGSVFVRADVTYLRQEFSVSLPVENSGLWPKEQRYDFLIRHRPATTDEVIRAQKKPADYPQREAVLRALRGLTGKDLGKSSKPWKDFIVASWQLVAK